MHRFFSTFLLAFAAYFAQAQTPSPLNLSQISHLPIYTHGDNNGANGGLVANDVTGFVKDGVEYAVVGFFKGTSVISLANPASPTEIGFFPAQSGTGNDWRDVEYWAGFAYVSQEGEGTGIHIIDLRTAPTNITARWWIPAPVAGVSLTSTHSVWQENGYLYLNGSSGSGATGYNGTLIYDVHTTPGTPIYLGKTSDGYVHDSFSRNDTLYTSNINEGVFRIYNISNKAAPTLVGTPTTTPSVFTHNTWTSNNGTHLFTTDEKANAFVASYNITNKSNIVETGRFKRYSTIGTGVIPHNVYTVANEFVVVAHYTDGVTIIDAKRPDNMIEVGNFDTHPAAIAGTPFEGVWACYPYAPSGAIYVADINEGFYLLQPTYTRACWLEGNVTDCAGNPLSDVTITIKQGTNNLNGTASKTTGVYKTGYAIAGTYTVTFTKTGYPTITQTVTLTNNQLTTLNVQMISPTGFTLTGTSKEATSTASIGNVRLDLTPTAGGATTTLTTNAAGVLNAPCFNGGTFNILVGKWGFKTKLMSNVTIANGQPLNVTLDKGYEDGFAMDLGWSVAGGTCTQGKGVWIRTTPDNIVSGANQVTPSADNATDIGNLVYLTGSGGGQPGADDLDLCDTYLTTPPMNLASMSDPHIKFDYWFQSLATSGGGSSTDDRFWIILNNGIETDTVLAVNTPSGVWRTNQDIRVRNFQTPTTVMTCSFRIIDQGVANWVKGSLDAFSVYDVVATDNIAFAETTITTQPNPFNETTLVRYDLDNTLTGNARLEIYNALGQNVQTISLTDKNGSVNIGADLPKGVYQIRIAQGGRLSKAQQIVKM